jgi:DNA-binding NarL/FixJ family response regulator
MSTLLLSTDLMLGSQVSGAAARTGASVQSFGSAEKLLERLIADEAALVILDLGLSTPNVATLVATIRQRSPSAKVIAFGPHVHKQRLEAAAAAGCDQVMSRGQFHAAMDQLLAAHAG